MYLSPGWPFRLNYVGSTAPTSGAAGPARVSVKYPTPHTEYVPVLDGTQWWGSVEATLARYYSSARDFSGHAYLVAKAYYTSHPFSITWSSASPTSNGYAVPDTTAPENSYAEVASFSAAPAGTVLHKGQTYNSRFLYWLTNSTGAHSPVLPWPTYGSLAATLAPLEAAYIADKDANVAAVDLYNRVKAFYLNYPNTDTGKTLTVSGALAIGSTVSVSPSVDLSGATNVWYTWYGTGGVPTGYDNPAYANPSSEFYAPAQVGVNSAYTIVEHVYNANRIYDPVVTVGGYIYVALTYNDSTGASHRIESGPVGPLAAAATVVAAADSSSISILGTPTVGSTVQLDYSLVTTLSGVSWLYRKYAWYIGSTLLSTSQIGFQIPTTIVGSSTPVAGSSLTAKLSFTNQKNQSFSYTSPPVIIEAATVISVSPTVPDTVGPVSGTHRYLTSSVYIKVTPDRGARIAPVTTIDLSNPVGSPLSFGRLDVHTLISGLPVLLTGTPVLVRRDRHLVVSSLAVGVAPQASTRVGAKRRALISAQNILIDPTAGARFFRSTAPVPLVSSIYVTVYADAALGRVVIGPPAPLVSTITVMVIPASVGAFRDPGPRTYTAGTWVPVNPRVLGGSGSVVLSADTSSFDRKLFEYPAPLVSSCDIRLTPADTGFRRVLTTPVPLEVVASIVVIPEGAQVQYLLNRPGSLVTHVFIDTLFQGGGTFTTPELIFKPGAFAEVTVAPSAQFVASGMIDGLLVEQDLPEFTFEVDDFLQYFFMEVPLPSLFSFITGTEQVIEIVAVDLDGEIPVLEFDTIWTDPYSDGLTAVLPVPGSDITIIVHTYWSIDLVALDMAATIEGSSYDPTLTMDADLPVLGRDISGTETFADYVEADIPVLSADILMGIIEFISIEVTDDIVLGGEITFAGDFVAEGEILGPEPDITFAENMGVSADIEVLVFDGDFVDPIMLDIVLDSLSAEISLHSFDATNELPVLVGSIEVTQEAAFSLDADIQLPILDAVFADSILVDAPLSILVGDIVLAQSPFIGLDISMSPLFGDIEWHAFTMDSIIAIPVTYGTKGNQYI